MVAEVYTHLLTSVIQDVYVSKQQVLFTWQTHYGCKCFVQ